MEASKTGKCWCGCGRKTKAHFVSGHDRKAEAALLDIVYGKGRTVEKLAMLGYSPKNSVRKARDRLGASPGGDVGSD